MTATGICRLALALVSVWWMNSSHTLIQPTVPFLIATTAPSAVCRAEQAGHYAWDSLTGIYSGRLAYIPWPSFKRMRLKLKIGWRLSHLLHAQAFSWILAITIRNWKWHNTWSLNSMISAYLMNGIYTAAHTQSNTGARMSRSIFNGMRMNGIIHNDFTAFIIFAIQETS